MNIEVTIKNIVDFYKQYPEYIGKIKVNTPYGYKKILNADKTDHSKPMLIQTQNNNICISSLNHRYKINDEDFKYAKQLMIGDKVLGKNGLEKIVHIEQFKKPIDLYDIEVQDVHQYYSNNLVSHNSVIMIDSILFALYGRTLKNTSNQYLSNRYCDKKLKTFVKLYFQIDGIDYSSECYCKPYSKTVGMILEKFDPQTQEWIDLTQSSVIKTRQYILENVLNCSFELFTSSIIISASGCLNFYQGMTKQQKRNYVQNIFNLNCFGQMYNMIKSDINDLKKQITFNNNEIIKNTNQLNELKLKFDSYNQKLNNNINNIKQQIIDNCNQIKELQNKKEELDKQYSDYDKDNEQYKSLKSQIKKINIAKNTLEKQNVEYQTKISSVSNLINQINKIKEGLCDTCSQVLNKRYNFNKKLNQIKEFESNINSNNQKILQLEQVLDKDEKQLELYENNILNMNNIKNNIDNILLEIRHINSDVKRLNNEYQELTNQKNNPFNELIISTEQELKKLKNQLQTYHNNSKHLDILKEVCSQNGVKSFIIKDIVKLLNSLIQKYLNEIGAEYLVYFDESFDFKFITMSGECQYSNFSAGERQRIQIATTFAFRDLILNGKINSNIFIIDEFLDSAIDSICIKNVLEILYKKTIDQKQNIFIISHRQETTEHHIFNNIIQIIKQNGFSTIKVN